MVEGGAGVGSGEVVGMRSRTSDLVNEKAFKAVHIGGEWLVSLRV